MTAKDFESKHVSLEEAGNDIKVAAENVEGIVNKTELIYSDFFSSECRNNVYLKPENLQFTGSFKIRGAYNKIVRLPESIRKNGIVASSAGNHAQGVAYSAKRLGISSKIVMPSVTPLIKVEATKAHGSEVVIHGDIYDDAYQKAMDIAKTEGREFVHPFNDYDVICGQGTIGLEIVEELKDVDEILVPIGGGGLIAGIAMAVKSVNPNIRVIGVEPEGAMTMKNSLNNDKVCDLSLIRTSAEGVAVKRPGDLSFQIAKCFVDGIVTVSEKEIMEALLMLIDKHKLIAETAGVLTLAALKKLTVTNKKIVSVISGGNIDVVTISSMINKGLISRGRIFCFSVDLPDVPGQLLHISKILSDLKANVIKLDHNQFKAMDRYENVQLEVTVETNGHLHIDEIIEALLKDGFKVNRVY
ncbi:threonine ammonia-lyase [Tindallia californiensis]|uniref:L-threonine dehydratase catabolic TdcB n=1 Tax=Tindallia californiensis TaxID=159292 RepID=A0A1H3Q8F1_9FIRM|nr:threonine ammonia-lyase [Tindallia californiensis]SDZ09814.1 threonine dehydratase [Tindallia californiensis]